MSLLRLVSPKGYDQNLTRILKALIARGVIVKVCGIAMRHLPELREKPRPSGRGGCQKNQPYFEGAEQSTMPALAEWAMDSDKVISFRNARSGRVGVCP